MELPGALLVDRASDVGPRAEGVDQARFAGDVKAFVSLHGLHYHDLICESNETEGKRSENVDRK
jgi:hypothetical protein